MTDGATHIQNKHKILSNRTKSANSLSIFSNCLAPTATVNYCNGMPNKFVELMHFTTVYANFWISDRMQNCAKIWIPKDFLGSLWNASFCQNLLNIFFLCFLIFFTLFSDIFEIAIFAFKSRTRMFARMRIWGSFDLW